MFEANTTDLPRWQLSRNWNDDLRTDHVQCSARQATEPITFVRLQMCNFFQKTGATRTTNNSNDTQKTNPPNKRMFNPLPKPQMSQTNQQLYSMNKHTYYSNQNTPAKTNHKTNAHYHNLNHTKPAPLRPPKHGSPHVERNPIENLCSPASGHISIFWVISTAFVVDCCLYWYKGLKLFYVSTSGWYNCFGGLFSSSVCKHLGFRTMELTGNWILDKAKILSLECWWLA